MSIERYSKNEKCGNFYFCQVGKMENVWSMKKSSCLNVYKYMIFH